MSSGSLDRQIDVADVELARQRMDYAGVLNNPALSETIQGIVRSLGIQVQRGMRTQQDLVEALAEPALPVTPRCQAVPISARTQRGYQS